jgi:hypothetical protein
MGDAADTPFSLVVSVYKHTHTHTSNSLFLLEIREMNSISYVIINVRRICLMNYRQYSLCYN